MTTIAIDAPDLSQLASRLGRIHPLSSIRDPSSAFRKSAKPLTRKQRHLLLEQANLALSQVYVHLSLKRTRRAVDPVAALRGLEQRADSLDDLDFHVTLQNIFKELKDVHTTYVAPPPYANAVAFLPFTIESYFEAPKGDDGPRRRRFIIADLLAGFEHPRLRQGTEITHWNGAPIEIAVRRFGEREVGSNPAASFALGQKFMTVRWLGASPPPDDDWVDLRVGCDGDDAYLRFPWFLLELDPKDRFDIALQAVWALEKSASARPSPPPATADEAEEPGTTSAVNHRTLVEHMARKVLFAPAKHLEHEAQRTSNLRKLNAISLPQEVPNDGPVGAPVMAHAISEDDEIKPLIPDVFEARVIQHGGERFGYIRIRHFKYEFAVERDADFVKAFVDLVTRMPRRGLILDIRGNPGGWIPCAERILQVLTPENITPLPFQFMASRLTEDLTDAEKVDNSLVRKWGPPVKTAVQTGALYSAGRTITIEGGANNVGQWYFGPVTLIVDAITYSSGDVFAASFQDHGIGDIIGVDALTGGGGANVWSHSTLSGYAPNGELIKPLPTGAQISYAVRRCVRVGKNVGMPIEEVGVVPDQRHWTTKDDLLNCDVDLMAQAAEALLRKPQREFEPALSCDEGQVRIGIRVVGVDRVDVFADGAPVSSLRPSRNGGFEMTFPTTKKGRLAIELRGYAAGDFFDVLVARYKDRLPTGL